MDKKTGYFLLALGVAFVLGGAALMLASFYGGLPFPQPFDMTGDISFTLSNNSVMSVPMPPQVNKAANISVFFVMVFFLAGAGVKLGGLGIKLIQKDRPVKDETPK